MFTGIVTHIGEVTVIRDGSRNWIRIACPAPAAPDVVGASICCSGICLTATAIEPNGDTATFDADLSTETLNRTTAAIWTPSRRINLERPLRVGDELGGHLVTGHVDGTAELLARESDNASERFRFRVPDHLRAFVATKGSVALDGISLTVAAVDGSAFEVSVIPHTLQVTTIGDVQVGDHVNIEVDTLARYVNRMQEVQHAPR